MIAVSARVELGAFGVASEQIERGAPHELCRERPRLAGGADLVAQRQLVEHRSFEQVDEREQPLDRQVAFEGDAVEIGDETAARIDPAFADAKREQLHEQLADAVAVLGLEHLGAAEGKDRHRVPDEQPGPVEDDLGDLLAQIGLDVPDVRVRRAAFHG